MDKKAAEAEKVLKDLQARVEMIEKGNGTAILRDELKKTRTELAAALEKIKALEAGGASAAPAEKKEGAPEEKKEIPVSGEDQEWRKQTSAQTGPHPFVVVRKLTGSTHMLGYTLNDQLREIKEKQRAVDISKKHQAECETFKKWMAAQLKDQFVFGSQQLNDKMAAEEAAKQPFLGTDLHNLYTELLFVDDLEATAANV